MAKVEVRPIPKDKWHGKKGQEAFGQPATIEVLYDRETGKYATGMTPEEAARLGKELGVDLSDTFNPNEAHPYWSTKPASIKLPIHTIYLDPNKPAELVKIYNLKASKFVANSQKELEEGKWSFATHVIFDENDEINLRASKVNLKKDCYAILGKMSDEDKINIIQILGDKSVRGRSSDFLNVEIDDLINTKTEQFLETAKMGRDEVYIRATVLEAIHKNILTKEGSAIYYMGEALGFDNDAVYAWFRNPQNSRMKMAILDKLTSR